MDLQTIVNVLLAGLGGLTLFVLNYLHSRINRLADNQDKSEDRQQKVELLVAGSYITKDDHAKADQKIHAILLRIENKLDGVPCKQTHYNSASRHE